MTNEEVCKDVSITDELLSELADLTEGFVGAEIEQAVVAALFEAFSEERGLHVSDLEKVIKNTVPLSVTQAEQIISIREWANVRAVAATAKEDRSEYLKKDNSISSKLEEDTGESKSDDENNSESAIKKARGGRTIDF